MKSIYTLLCVLCIPLLMTQEVSAQDGWPKTMSQGNKVIKMYQWQPESYGDNTLKARAAVSVLEEGKTDPVFGMAWLRATTQPSGDQVLVQSARITSIKLPGESNDDQLDDLKIQLEEQVGRWNIRFAQKDLENALSLNSKQNELSQQISNKPPKVIYANSPSILVLIDGSPRLQKNTEWDAEVVVNTPFTIVKTNGQFWLYGGKHWYSAPAATGPYALQSSVSQQLNRIAEAIKATDKDQEEGMETNENTLYKIIVSTEPAELIQSNGEANFSPVEGTGLLYVANSDDDIFMDISSQQYFVLLSGRWFASKTLSGSWQYVSPENLPAEFARIQEGSPKDNVLASVAGTDAAADAIQEAEVPQTAKVDRKNAKANIAYDGDPEFEEIDGLDLAYATNTSASVLRWRGRYYAVDNGVWFEATRASGPWSVAIERPSVVSLIPPSYPVYNTKYVYIYDVMPDYVYMGYTPGYLNTYIYGPTVVYGTGFYYSPWYGHYYYPRPCTWGYGVRYNPWFGWGFGFNFNAGWFHVGVNIGRPWGGYYGGGWWGPRYYSMPYCYRPYYGGRPSGYYSPHYYNNRARTIHYANRTNNVYVNRNYVVTRTVQRNIAPNRSNYYGRRDNVGYNNNNGGNVQRPSRTYNNDNRGQQYNNRNGQPNTNRPVNRSYERNNRTDYPQSRQREITPNSNGRPSREVTPNNNGNRPGNNGSERPVRTYERRETEQRPTRSNDTREGNTNRGAETPRRQYNQGGNTNPNRESEAPRREYNRGGNETRQAPPARTTTPQPRQEPRQQPAARPQSSQPSQQPARTYERRESSGGNRGGGNQGGGSQGGGSRSSGGRETSRPGRG